MLSQAGKWRGQKNGAACPPTPPPPPTAPCWTPRHGGGDRGGGGARPGSARAGRRPRRRTAPRRHAAPPGTVARRLPPAPLGRLPVVRPFSRCRRGGEETRHHTPPPCLRAASRGCCCSGARRPRSGRRWGRDAPSPPLSLTSRPPPLLLAPTPVSPFIPLYLSPPPLCCIAATHRDRHHHLIVRGGGRGGEQGGVTPHYGGCGRWGVAAGGARPCVCFVVVVWPPVGVASPPPYLQRSRRLPPRPPTRPPPTSPIAHRHTPCNPCAHTRVQVVGAVGGGGRRAHRIPAVSVAVWSVTPPRTCAPPRAHRLCHRRLPPPHTPPCFPAVPLGGARGGTRPGPLRRRSLLPTTPPPVVPVGRNTSTPVPLTRCGRHAV